MYMIGTMYKADNENLLDSAENATQFPAVT